MDLTYTFNRITKRGSVVATAKNLSPTIEYTYYVFDNSASEWKYDETHYITAITGKNWTECEMINVNGTYIYSVAEKALTAGNRYGSRFVEKITATGVAEQTNWLWIGDDNGGSQGCRCYDCTSTGTYNIVYTYTPSECNYDLPSSQPKLSVTQGFYALNSGDSWANGLSMTFEGGFYKATLANVNDKYIALAPTEALSSSDDWNNAIRPEYNTSDGAKYTVNFMTYSGTGKTGGNSTWYVDGEGIDIDISYRPADNYWEVKPFRTATIGTAGYATYSNGEKYTVSDATAMTVTANSASAVTLTEQESDVVYPANGGIILKGASGAVAKINAVASDAVATLEGTNYLVGSGNATKDITAGDGIYVFNWDGTSASSIGFYKANSGTLGAHKAYLDISGAGAREFLSFNFEGETTGISSMSREGVANNECYNLAGQRVAQPTKGLYIVNGKKVVVK